jgi:hypothetical protein
MALLGGSGGGGGSNFSSGTNTVTSTDTTGAPLIKISWTVPPPTVTITTPANGATYGQGQTVNASYSCQDGVDGPGIASCTGPVANGSPIDTSTPGSHSFTVTAKSLDGQTGSASVTYMVAAPPTVTSVSPTTGPAAGGTSVTITGTNFTAVTAVKFGSANATSFKVNSESSITAVSPAGTGTVDVTVTTPGGTSATSAADQFTYGPTVTKVEPKTGSPSGGTTVTITGTGFTGATAVKFGSTNATSFKVNSATSITAISPKSSPMGSSTVDVTVTTPAGTSPTSSADQFTYKGQKK